MGFVPPPPMPRPGETFVMEPGQKLEVVPVPPQTFAKGEVFVELKADDKALYSGLKKAAIMAQKLMYAKVGFVPKGDYKPLKFREPLPSERGER